MATSDRAPLPFRPTGTARRVGAVSVDPALHPLALDLADHLRDSSLFGPGARLTVAVSGGRDSVVLLHLLRFALPDWELRLFAAHLDHAMRPSAAGDALWVRGLCQAWNLPLVGARAAPPPATEVEARALRYRFLRRAAAEQGTEAVLTAHHADDQAETVLFRAARGGGIRGLGGIPPRRGPFLRPLLPFRRARLDAYAVEQGIRHREDPSNASGAYARNRIRQEVLPALEAAVPGAGRSLARLADHAREEERAWNDVLERLAREALLARNDAEIHLARAVLLSYHPGARARLFRYLVRRFGAAPTRAATRAALDFAARGESGARVDLPGGIVLEREFDSLVIRLAAGGPDEAAERPLAIPDRGPGAGEARVGGRRIGARWGPARADRPGSGTGEGGEGVVLCETGLAFPLVLRSRRPGDRIRLSYGSKKLKKLFAETRVPRRARPSVPVLADGEGRILWVGGVGRAAGMEPVQGEPTWRIRVFDVE